MGRAVAVGETAAARFPFTEGRVLSPTL